LTPSRVGSCMEGMWLMALRVILYGLSVLLLAAVAFVGGVYTAKKSTPQPLTEVVEEIPPERRRAARELVELALAERFAGRHAEALDYLQQARTQDRTMRGLDYQFGLTYLDLRDYEAALAAARRSVERNEEASNAHALAALVLLEGVPAGGSVEAVREEILESVRRSREEDPLNPMPLYVLAEFYRAAGQPERAVDAYQRAIERVSKTDSIMVSTVKAGLAGIRLHHDPSAPPLVLLQIDGVHPPEQLFFGAADALLRGDRERAEDYLRQARERLPQPLFDALLQDSFFQDFLTGGILTDRSEDSPQP
jgi:tetratricopeptide (TPR) repeat protein